MFFNSRSQFFVNPLAARYCDVQLARDIQAAYDMGPCPYTGLMEAGRLLYFYNYLTRLFGDFASQRPMQRHIGQMMDWAGRLYLKAAKHNRPFKLKMRLLSDPAFRARVLSELGGERALQRWECLMAWVRHSVAPGGESAPSSLHIETDEYSAKALFRYDTPYDPKHSHRARTDARGEFRLAPIPRGKQFHLHKAPSRGPRRAWYKVHPPVSLRPHELRGHTPPNTLAYFRHRYGGPDPVLRLTDGRETPNAPPDYRGPL